MIGRASGGMQVVYKTSAVSVERTVWLASWQEWAVGADVEHLLSGEGERANLLRFFKELAKRDRRECKCVD